MQPKTLTNFMNELKTKGIRKKNQFQIVITSGHTDIDKSLENFTMWANSAALPSRTQEFQEVPYQAYPFQIPSRMVMSQEMDTTIKCDSDGEIRRAILKWASYTSNPAISDGSIGEGNKKIPAGSHIRIILFKDDMETISEIYKLVGAQPEEIGQLDLSNEDAEIATFDVKWRYQYWELEEAEGKFNDIR